MHRLLIVGPAGTLEKTLAAHSTLWDVTVEIVPKGADAMTAAQEAADLVLLRLHLPDMDGLAWLKIFRRADRGAGTPVIILAEKRDDADVLSAFEFDADDFLPEDCDPGELIARIRAALRRREPPGPSAEAPLAVGPVRLDPERHECRVRGKNVDLKPREFMLLEALMRRAGRVLSRAYLLETVWGMSRQADTRAVYMSVSRLRAALGRSAGRWIETVENIGYKFRSE